MSRQVHLWFFVGFLMAVGSFVALLVVAGVAQGLGTEGKVFLFSSMEIILIGVAVSWVRMWSRYKARLHARISRELSCSEARRLRVMQRIGRTGV